MGHLERIRLLCRGKGISIAKLERDLGFGNGSLAKSKNIGLERLERIAEYFGVKASDLIESDGYASIANDEDERISEYIRDPAIRKLVLYAGGAVPGEGREMLVDAMINSIEMLKKAAGRN